MMNHKTVHELIKSIQSVLPPSCQAPQCLFTFCHRAISKSTVHHGIQDILPIVHVYADATSWIPKKMASGCSLLACGIVNGIASILLRSYWRSLFASTQLIGGCMQLSVGAKIVCEESCVSLLGLDIGGWETETYVCWTWTDGGTVTVGETSFCGWEKNFRSEPFCFSFFFIRKSTFALGLTWVIVNFPKHLWYPRFLWGCFGCLWVSLEFLEIFGCLWVSLSVFEESEIS